MTDMNPCPVCSSGEYELFIETQDFFLTQEKFSIARCKRCGFIFTHNPPSEKEIGRYYESQDYVSHDDNAPGFVNSVYRGVRSFMLRRKRNLVKHLTQQKTGKILDIGSGTGHFLEEMKGAGWITKGIEISQKAREFSVNELHLDIIPPEEIKSFESGSFDCITLWHVLEHFHDPDGYASEIYRLLKPGGTCLVALPNCSSYDAVHYGKYWAAYDVPRHLWHFTPATFRKFSEKNGFNLTDIKRMPADVFYISSVSEKYKGTRLSFFTGILKGLWFSVRTFFNREGSSSLIYVLSKKQSS